MNIIIFLLILVVLILVHEFGHFIVAKKSGIRVDEFGIGFPPKLWGKKYGETEYTINALPVGGFVRIWGEDPTEEVVNGPDQERSFIHKPKYIQAAVLVAGVAMNILLAFVLYVVAFMTGVPVAYDEATATREEISNAHLIVSAVLPETPAQELLNPGDEILSLTQGEDSITTTPLLSSDVSSFVARHPNKPIMFEILRRNEVHTISITPKKGVIATQPDRAAAGFSMALVGTEKLPFFEAVGAAATRTVTTLRDIVIGLWDLLKQSLQGTADFSQIAGPVGIVGLVGDAAALGVPWLLTFTAFISLNLAVINLLPIPALDGGRLLFVLIEAIIRRPIPHAWVTRMNQVGFALLLLLMLAVTFNDVKNLLHF